MLGTKMASSWLTHDWGGTMTGVGLLEQGFSSHGHIPRPEGGQAVGPRTGVALRRIIIYKINPSPTGI